MILTYLPMHVVLFIELLKLHYCVLTLSLFLCLYVSIYVSVCMSVCLSISLSHSLSLSLSLKILLWFCEKPVQMNASFTEFLPETTAYMIYVLL